MIQPLTENMTEFAANSFLQRLDYDRHIVSGQLNPKQRSLHGQFMTPINVAAFMASLFDDTSFEHFQLLDPGAGMGSLTSAFIVDVCERTVRPKTVSATAYELDALLFDNLNITLAECRRYAQTKSLDFSFDVNKVDFVQQSVSVLQPQLFRSDSAERFTHVIMNPPYHKIRSNSDYRKKLSSVQIETSNLYTAFMALAILLLKPEGQLVAIVPRSFCNGPYFRSFRHLFNRFMSFRKIHVFASRDQLFQDDEVLQENVIFHAVKNTADRDTITITSSDANDFHECTTHCVDYSLVMNAKDKDLVIHIPTNELDYHVLERLNCFDNTLADIGLAVSTGRVVDFRCTDYLCPAPQKETVPLLYPHHFLNGRISWPGSSKKKPNAIKRCDETVGLLHPNQFYVLVRRFSSKEEPKRINTALSDPNDLACDEIAFENHVNYYHVSNHGLPPLLAKGLKLYLDSTLVDIYFRNFNGHTQVNASDLKLLRYPSRDALERMGKQFDRIHLDQDAIDTLVEREVTRMAKIGSPDPVKAKKKLDQAILIITDLGLPRAQLNDRSALTLLALLDIKPSDKWSNAKARKIGITPIMEFCKQFYGRDYAPNTRETFRRQTMHQFVQAGLVIENPDDPKRPINSPYWCYEIEANTLKLIQSFQGKSYSANLSDYLAHVETLKDRYAKTREMNMVPVVFPDGNAVKLSPGKHNDLMRDIIEKFAPAFAPGSAVLYLGDTGQKWGFFDRQTFEKMDIEIDEHGKMPDVVLHYGDKDWVLLIEAVTSHGPVDGKRRAELAKLFEPVKDKLIYVTAFPDRATMSNYIKDISWETEVWVAENPDHLIHFNGVRFLGPYRT